MPSLPRSPFGRRRANTEVAPERTEPRVEIVESPGLRWINIERPRSLEQAWLEEHFDFHPLDYEDVRSRNQRPKVDEYDDYLFIVLHFPAYDKNVSRLNAAELDIFVGPDFLITLPNEPLQTVEYLFQSCRRNEELRENLFSKGTGYLLYKIVDVAGPDEEVELAGAEPAGGGIEDGEVEDDEEVVVVDVDLRPLVAREHVLEVEGVELEVLLQPLALERARPLDVDPAQAGGVDLLDSGGLGLSLRRRGDQVAAPAGPSQPRLRKVRHRSGSSARRSSDAQG